MNLTVSEGQQLVKDILASEFTLTDKDFVIICPPFTHIQKVGELLEQSGNKKVLLGAQNCYFEPAGAYTGEVSIPMLKDLGVRAVIVGHSERRQYFNESNELLKKKVDALLQNHMTPIFCCGEPLEVREAGTQNEFVQQQLEESLFHLSADMLAPHVVIAYEPIWAIGTGKTASTEQAQDTHQFIRQSIAAKYGQEVANKVSILYGGSCKPSNAPELMACTDVDGGLIGGAALVANDFVGIIKALN